MRCTLPRKDHIARSVRCGDASGNCAEYTFDAELATGDHEIQLRFVEYEGGADASLRWQMVEGFQCSDVTTTGDGARARGAAMYGGLGALGDDGSVVFQLRSGGQAHLIFSGASGGGEYDPGLRGAASYLATATVMMRRAPRYLQHARTNNDTPGQEG